MTDDCQNTKDSQKLGPIYLGGLAPPNPWYPPPMTLNVTWCGSWRGPTLQPNSLLAA